MRRRLCKFDVKDLGLTWEWHQKLQGSRAREENGIASVEVKFVDIRKNTSGEGDFLARYLTLRHESVGSKQD